MRQGDSHRAARAGRPRPRYRNRRPLIEALEQRSMLSLTTQFAVPVAVTGAGSVDVESNAVANDAAGFVYVTGSLSGTANFAPSGSAVNLTSAGDRDIVIAKYTAAGALVWAEDLPGAGSSSVGQGSAVAVDGSGNIFISGTFTGTTDFNPKSGTTNLTATNRNDAFVAKYDSNGNFLWVQDFAGPAGTVSNPGPYNQGYALTTDSTGNVYVAGSYQGTTTFGTSGPSLTAAGTYDEFVAKLSSAGSVAWAKGTSGSGSSVTQAAGLAVDSSGDVITTGFYAGTVNFNPNASGAAVSLTSAGSRDIYVQKLDSSGSLLWAEGFGSPDIDQGNSIAVDSSGNLYVAGVYSDSVNFNPGTGAAVTLTATGFEDAFLMKLTSAGALAWADDMGGTGFNFAQATGIGIDAAGHVYVAGHYNGTIALSPGNSADTLTSVGDFDVFIAEYNSAGGYIAGQSNGGSNTDYDFGIGVNATGQVAIAGRYTGPATFGSVTLPAEPSKSIYIAQFLASQTLSTPPAPSLLGSDDSGVKGDNITNVTQPHFTGTADPSTTIQLINSKGLVIATAPVGTNGIYTVQVPSALSLGTASFSVREQDSHGNLSALSPTITITILTTPPSAPSTPVLLASDDSGAKGDNITNVNDPHLTGTVATNTTIQLVNASGTVIGSIAATAGGTYSVTPTTALADGTYVLHVQAVDVAGNISTASGTLSLTIDTTPPAAPSTPALLASDDSGTVGDGITNLTQPHLIGTAAANATINLLNAGNTVIGTGTATAGGTYSIQPASALTDGVYSLHVAAIDVAGNVSAASGSFSLTIDTTPPAAPSTPTLLGSDDSGAVGDGITNVKQPHLTGTAVASTTIELLNAANTVIATGTSMAGGTYSIQPTSALADGVYSLHVVAIDVGGNVSAVSGSFSLTIDTTPPAAPSTPTLLGSDDSGTVGDGITNVTQPHLTGTAAANTTIELLNAANIVYGVGTATAGGTYSIPPSIALTDGVYSFHVVAIDVAGNVGAASGSFSLTIDTTPPAAPSTPTLLASDDTGTVGDGITTVPQPHLIGTAEANDTLQLLNGSGTVIGTAIVSGTDAYSVTPSSPLAVGTYSLTVRAIDAAGNVGSSSGAFSLQILTAPTAPSAPSLLSTDDSGTKGDNITNVTQPHLTGTGTPGTTVQIITSAGTVLGSGPVESNGAYSVQPSSPLGNGTYTIEARTLNAGGGLSGPSAALTLTILSTPPAAPSTPALLASDDSGAVGDNITNVTRPHVTGTAAAGVTVQLLDGSGNLFGSVLVGSGGTYSIQPTNAFTSGTIQLHTRAVDVAGNVSASSATLSLTIMATPPPAPAAPALLAADDTTTVPNRTTIRTPQLVGTTIPGDFVDLLSSTGAVLASTTAAAGNGSYVLQPSTAFSPGVVSLSVRLRDVAGNTGSASPALSLTIAEAPAADFDGDGKSDLGTFTPTTAQWVATYSSSAGTMYTTSGMTNLTDIPVPGDYDGIGKNEVAVYRPSTAQWIISSPTGTRTVTFGAPNTDIPVPGDYDGVGHTEIAVFRPSTAQWFVLGPNGGHLLATFGATNLTDVPVPGDYDGVGHTEPAVFRPSTAQWIVLGPSGGHVLGSFGAHNLSDIPVPGDYDGVGHTEMAVFRPSTAQWFVVGPNGGRVFAVYGSTGLSSIPLEAPIASLKALGIIGGVTSATKGAMSVPAPQAMTNGSITPLATSSQPVTTTKHNQNPQAHQPAPSDAHHKAISVALELLEKELIFGRRARRLIPS